MSLRDASLHWKFSKASQRKTPVLCYLPGLRGGRDKECTCLHTCARHAAQGVPPLSRMPMPPPQVAWTPTEPPD